MRQAQPFFEVDANKRTILDYLTSKNLAITEENALAAIVVLHDTLLIAPEFSDGWSAFIQKHPQYGNKANMFRAFEILNGDDPTVSNFEEIAALPDQPLVVNSRYETAVREQREKEQLVEELKNPNLASLDLTDLRHLVAQKREQKRLQSLSTEELRKVVRHENPVPQPAELPGTYKPIGSNFEIALTSEAIRIAGSRGADLNNDDLRFLIRRYGADKVNARLFGRD